MININNIPKGYSAVQEPDGSITLVKQQTQGTLDIVHAVHAALVTAGAQIPTAIAAPLTIAALPSAIDTGFSVAANIATGNYIAAITQGVPLLISGITALYVNLSQPKGKTDAQIVSYIGALSRDQLISLLRSDTAGQVQQNTAAVDGAAAASSTNRPVASSSN